MCLSIKDDDVVKVAKKDIVCYKVIGKMYGSSTYKTIFKKFNIHLGKKYTSEMKEKRRGYTEREIAQGLHSYSSKKECVKDIRHDIREDYSYLSDFIPGKITVIKCIIPKDSKYFKGKFEACNAYASDTLLYTEEIIWQPKIKKS